MDNKPLVADYLVQLTNTAITKLGLDTNVSLRNSIVNACINFRHYTLKKANQSLFILFYGNRAERDNVIRSLFSSKYICIMGEYTTNHKTSIPCFDEETILVVANELLYQYSAATPEFLRLENHVEYQKELDALKATMSNHPVLLFRAVKQCELICHLEAIVPSCLNYLLSEDTTSNMIGLKEMGHNFQHRVLLLPYARQIGLLLQAMHKTKDTGKNRIFPFTTWLSQHEEGDFVNHSATELPKVLLLDELVKSSDLIRSLPRSSELEQYFQRLNFDANLLLEKEEYLALVKAIVSLLYAKQNFFEAQADFALGDQESIYNFYSRNKDLEKATEIFNCALDNFFQKSQ